MSNDDRSYRVLHTDRLPAPFGVWSPVVEADPGRLVFISGMVARDPSGKVVGEGDYEAQTRQICENLTAAVEAAGGTRGNIAMLQAFVLDVAHFDTITRVRRDYFPVDPPTSTMVQVTRLLDEKCLLEINAIAVVPHAGEA